jgi:hypothetical protein
MKTSLIIKNIISIIKQAKIDCMFDEENCNGVKIGAKTCEDCLKKYIISDIEYFAKKIKVKEKQDKEGKQ